MGGEHPLVVKRAAPGRGAARLRAEAAVLSAARHPGVVSVLWSGEVATDAGEVVELRLRLAGSRTLASLTSVRPTRAAALVAFVATTVADLHSMGIAHGRISPDHVVVAADGRPVLCGFGDASSLGSGSPATTAADVAALGGLLRHLLEPDPTGDAPTRTSLARRTEASVRRALLDLADQCCDPDPLRRPSPSRLATAIHQLVPTTPVDPDESAREAKSTLAAWPADAELALAEPSLVEPSASVVRLHEIIDVLSRHRIVAMAPVVAVLVAVAAATVLPGGSAPATPALHASETPIVASPDDPATAESANVTTTSSVAAAAVDDVAEAMGCATDAAAGITFVGAACPVAMHFADGVLSVGNARFGIALASAVIAIGDFACAGAPTAGVVDLATGDVFVFDAWATGGADVTAARVDQVEAPLKVIAEPDGSGCHRLVVLDEWGIRHLVEPAPAPAPPPTAPPAPAPTPEVLP